MDFSPLIHGSWFLCVDTCVLYRQQVTNNSLQLVGTGCYSRCFFSNFECTNFSNLFSE